VKPLVNAKPGIAPAHGVRPGSAPGSPKPTTRPGLDRPPTSEERRRAQRVLLKMEVVIHVNGKPPMQGHTHTVSANGAMVVIPEPLTEGMKVTVENPKTKTKVEAQVVRPPQITAEGSLVPVEFATPSPRFWNIFFPPAIN
jgi:hypothetical protein